MSEQRKAVALISGGLDSLLAARVIQEQGIHVEGINFFTGFCVEGHTHAIRKRDQKKEKRNNALWVAEQLGMKLHIVDIIEEYKQVLLNPKHGYGANLNPCLDCKVFMVHKAYEWIKAKDFDFIITGEVIGQRPMSQRKETMPIVCDESGAHDLLLRPLCAKNLPMTRPEIEGWVDRNRLYGFSGRSRKPQMALAAQFGIEDYAQPAGGCCFLTDEQYAVKLKDLWNARGSKQYELDDIMLLKVGRHLRPSSRFKVIIAREEGEANFLQGYRKRYPHINTVSHGGPLALIDGEINERDIELIGRVVARYSQGRNAAEVELRFTDLSGDSRSLKVVPMPAHQVPKEWLI
ncbi:MAG: tRNA (5-methylaminomethyl-2-thiouridylate)-methyltransferase [Candidatus Thiodiazotropha endolucinida]|uniref:tRNA-specific 2-thiouridylase MnmA n=1 Tax=Candidatus Thiodiazotropha endolucinida TaxID=1655433 RepID=A0A7Z1AH59_9GAMM|nr:tRNA (5-methylaminomethyl-2-thiouridylate)-methyltransferase [Candidatus Thiodiazotropha endolucinida]MBT3014683.1 tRNA (5-methylaminomethyl-2-thiouridylate)-methyltransferase [Candidatus Thiodiazotropha taylori]MBT3031836.1 tRNA (5-methylaminomethyl-2-thiouridylate)-methyltransferase [Candidatus Thiodiazotropha sp. (ex Lucina pensylvanica)]MBT3051755.1 tRNA (5-methylaminomethyl-2-thiouridylate)-methyltransferase [Candidatus Thiodiazotropha sp. (ex Codakia orbicularis)]ODJ89263.1 tRNA-specif